MESAITELLNSLGLVVSAVVAAALVAGITYLKRAAKKTETHIDDVIVAALEKGVADASNKSKDT
jgi:hypothetical protein